MGKNRIVLLVILMVFLAGCSSVSASPAARIVSGVVTNVVSTIFKRLWSLKSTSKTATSTRSMMKFESGYTVETVFDGSKLGIEPYSVEVSATGEVLVLDSENSNIYKISNPLSRCGKVGRGGGHVDGPSEDAKFSDDFDVVYIGSSCSLLVIDRGNQAIREIQLHEEDCSPQEDTNLHLGIAVLAAACFFGYMLALLQRRIAAMLSPDAELKAYAKAMPPAPYQKPPPKSVRPPLIPTEDDYDKEEEGLFSSLGRLFISTGSSIVEIFSGMFSGFRKKPFHHHMQQHHHHPSRHGNAWPVQESFVIPREDEPPQIDTREPTPRKSYPIMTKEMEKTRQPKQGRPYYNGWNGDYQQQPQRHVQQLQHHQHYQKHHPPGPQTYYEQQNCETNEIVFGAVQEQDGRREAMVIKAVDYGDPIYNNQNIRSRSYNYMSYSYGY
ncbi:UNVERIFIED_CONTAM: hypothetical protein Sradi_3050300 [Sesamum radiatum]|uniref:NHL domain-containing protein n=1 Tax=Sesamum radiatum TaxID=300843 RepID=A0AAW2RDM8_SESRA